VKTEQDAYYASMNMIRR